MDENEFKKLWKEVLKVFSDNKLNVNSISSLKTDVLISQSKLKNSSPLCSKCSHIWWMLLKLQEATQHGMVLQI